MLTLMLQLLHGSVVVFCDLTRQCPPTLPNVFIQLLLGKRCVVYLLILNLCRDRCPLIPDSRHLTMIFLENAQEIPVHHQGMRNRVLCRQMQNPKIHCILCTLASL
jgi:hypothetical protein